jgi:hypothetical protein
MDQCLDVVERCTSFLLMPRTRESTPQRVESIDCARSRRRDICKPIQHVAQPPSRPPNTSMARKQLRARRSRAAHDHARTLNNIHTTRILRSPLTYRHTASARLPDMVERARSLPRPNNRRLLPDRIPALLHFHRTHHARRARLVDSPRDVAARVPAEFLYAVRWQ